MKRAAAIVAVLVVAALVCCGIASANAAEKEYVTLGNFTNYGGFEKQDGDTGIGFTPNTRDALFHSGVTIYGNLQLNASGDKFSAAASSQSTTLTKDALVPSGFYFTAYDLKESYDGESEDIVLTRANAEQFGGVDKTSQEDGLFTFTPINATVKVTESSKVHAINSEAGLVEGNPLITDYTLVAGTFYSVYFASSDIPGNGSGDKTPTPDPNTGGYTVLTRSNITSVKAARVVADPADVNHYELHRVAEILSVTAESDVLAVVGDSFNLNYNPSTGTITDPDAKAQGLIPLGSTCSVYFVDHGGNAGVDDQQQQNQTPQDNANPGNTGSTPSVTTVKTEHDITDSIASKGARKINDDGSVSLQLTAKVAFTVAAGIKVDYDGGSTSQGYTVNPGETVTLTFAAAAAPEKKIESESELKSVAEVGALAAEDYPAGLTESQWGRFTVKTAVKLAGDRFIFAKLVGGAVTKATEFASGDIGYFVETSLFADPAFTEGHAQLSQLAAPRSSVSYWREKDGSTAFTVTIMHSTLALASNVDTIDGDRTQIADAEESRRVERVNGDDLGVITVRWLKGQERSNNAGDHGGVSASGGSGGCQSGYGNCGMGIYALLAVGIIFAFRGRGC